MVAVEGAVQENSCKGALMKANACIGACMNTSKSIDKLDLLWEALVA